MSVIVELDSTELLLWTILKAFESLALKQYELYVPELATSQKRDLVGLLSSKAPTDEPLQKSTLSSPLHELIAAATGTGAKQTLIVQGILLELLGRTIYSSFADNQAASSATRSMCIVGLQASRSNGEKIADLVDGTIGDGEAVFQAFLQEGRPIIARLEGLGDGLDEYFSQRFAVHFTDLVGEFVAELMPSCMALGMDRRRLMGSLAGALMGEKV